MLELAAVGIGVLVTVTYYLYEQNRIHGWVCVALILAAVIGSGVQYALKHGLSQLWTDAVAVTLLSTGLILLVSWLGTRLQGGDE